MRVEAFTFLRFLAALIVVIFHYGKNSGLAKLAPEFLTSGPQMVTFFFVLSGFVMVIAYYNKNQFSPTNYWINRAARILPVYLFALAISVLICMKNNTFEMTPFLLNLSLLQSWFSPYPLSINSPGWSLSVETFFYATFPFTILALRNNKITPKMAMCASFFIWLITQAILTYLLNAKLYQVSTSFLYDLIYYFPISHYCSFLIGISGAFVVLKLRKSWFVGNVIGSSTIISIIGTVWILENQNKITSWLGSSLPTGSSLWAPMFLILIMSVALNKNYLVSILSFKPFVVLGEASYSLYILQAPLHKIYKYFISPVFSLDYSIDFYVFALFLIFSSLCSFYLIEMPAKSLILKTWNKFKRKYLPSHALNADY